MRPGDPAHVRPGAEAGMSDETAELGSSQAATGPRERRGEPRMRTLKSGRIVAGRIDGGIDCLILDVSPGGARLKPLRSFVAPRAFALVFSDRSMRICELVWQGDTTLGVRFLD
jgi:hypothetical protein